MLNKSDVIKVIQEKRRAHQIWYLCFYLHI